MLVTLGNCWTQEALELELHKNPVALLDVSYGIFLHATILPSYSSPLSRTSPFCLKHTVHDETITELILERVGQIIKKKTFLLELVASDRFQLFVLQEEENQKFTGNGN